MPEPLLPELNADATVASFNAPGRWDSRSAKEIDDLRKSLKVTPARIQINSIPDIWARPLLFQMSLFDPGHPLHAKTLGEWRGLLAMLALKSVKGLNALTAVPIHVALNPNPSDNTLFLDAATRLRPLTTISPETRWEHSYIFLFHDAFKGRPIGMTSPTTLVFTSTHYFNHISNVQWFNTEYLTDPVEHLSALERPALSGWLGNLQLRLRSLTGENGTNNTILNSLTGLLDAFRTDLAAGEPPFEPASIGFDISRSHGVFHFLNNPAASQAPPPSPVGLIGTKGRSGGKLPILIVDKELPQQWGLAPQNIQVGTRTFANLTPAGHPSGIHNTFGGAVIADAEVWNASEFFTDRLSIFRVANAFPGTKEEHWEGNQRPTDISVILPIKEKLLNYLSPDDLLKRIIFERRAETSVRVTLKLALGNDETQREFVVTKEYQANDLEYLEEIPAIEVFPNFKRADWRTYYLAYSVNRRDDSVQVKPFVAEADPLRFTATTETDDNIQTVWRLNEYPEALVCQIDGEGCGLLFLSNPIATATLPNTFTVGVDFGASGTTVYHGTDAVTPTALTVNNHKLTVTNLTDVQKLRAYDLFLPGEAFTVPFLSLFKQFRNQPNLQAIEPILEGHIHYYNTDADSDLGRPDIYADLKWSNDPQSRFRVKALLTQICLQTAVELAARGATAIEWKFSFPTAFSRDQADNFSSIWDGIVRDCSSLTGLAFSPPKKLTESVAAAQFFREHQGATTALSAVFIDIGSSTSDISVWQNDELLWQISLRLAGRDIFLEYLKNHAEILRIFNVDTAKLEQVATSRDETKLWAETDALLQKKSDEIFALLPVQSPTDAVKKLRQHLALGLSGLVYYVGLGIRHLRKQGVFAQQLPNLYVGGNGSRMFRWLSDGNTTVNSTPAALFETVFKKALGTELPGSFTLEMSQLPKQEAAYGLVCRRSLQGAVGYTSDVIAGESFIRGDEEFGPDTVIDSEFFEQQVKPPKNLNQLSEFLDVFNQFAEQNKGFLEPVSWNARTIDTIRGDIAKDLNDTAGHELVDVEPIFVIALRSLLERNSKV